VNNRKQGLIFRIVLGIVFMIIFGLLGNLIIFPLLIPDECYYHGHEEPFLIKVLFDFPAYNGYHPVIAKWLYLFCGFSGYLLAGLIQKGTQKKSDRETGILDEDGRK
jgi:hypothetical protein